MGVSAAQQPAGGGVITFHLLPQDGFSFCCVYLVCMMGVVHVHMTERCSIVMMLVLAMLLHAVISAACELAPLGALQHQCNLFVLS
jgi:hypothetical protein